MHKELARDDLLARHPDHTFAETVVGGMTLVEFKDAEGNVVARHQVMNAADAYALIREQMGIGPEVPALLTTAQRDALSEPEKVGLVANTTTRSLNVYIGGAWR